jgi:hypothetical protein
MARKHGQKIWLENMVRKYGKDIFKEYMGKI